MMRMSSLTPLDFVSRVNVILGDLGTGKSAFAFWLARELSIRDNLPVVANVPCDFCVDVLDNPLRYESPAVLVLDEAHIILDSRAFATKLSREISQQLSFLRKRSQILIATFQYWGQVDIRLRSFSRGVWVAEGRWVYSFYVPRYNVLEESPEPQWENLGFFRIKEVQNILGLYDTFAIPTPPAK